GEIRVDVERRRASREAGNVEHISGDSFIQKEARPLFDVNTLQHLPDGFAVMTGLGVARLAFSSPLRVERREISLKTFPVLAKTDPLAEYLPPADGGGPKADDDFAGLY
ncbi:Mobilization protein A, partial [Klebsiella pneumoniae]|nr:Mobilization protein A [Klebsiella pneumoniae]